MTDGLPRTNNSVEGWHTAFQGSIQSAHPTFWRFVECLKREEGLQRAVYGGMVGGENPSQHLKKYERINKNIKTILDDENRSLAEKLEGISFNINLNP